MGFWKNVFIGSVAAELIAEELQAKDKENVSDAEMKRGIVKTGISLSTVVELIIEVVIVGALVFAAMYCATKYFS